MLVGQFLNVVVCVSMFFGVGVGQVVGLILFSGCLVG